ncbi:hypothetical protein OO013_19265 [Mangrovivirga sp. M17]|uniref:Uncharacterized protein n=1 Tax=Mangrovivirga halotolerans TaxID=2993936 RepID=A0ABT3RWK3_9BACT|nr:hypothetical protein [Mangrovivirga halotolerans]MCX2746028.1 hypothetical protein [Mangrovivirga halotolerans]
MANIFNPATTGIGESTSQLENTFESGIGGSVAVGSSTQEAPAAYLNYLYFDANFEFQHGDYIQVPETGTFQDNNGTPLGEKVNYTLTEVRATLEE